MWGFVFKTKGCRFNPDVGGLPRRHPQKSLWLNKMCVNSTWGVNGKQNKVLPSLCAAVCVRPRLDRGVLPARGRRLQHAPAEMCERSHLRHHRPADPTPAHLLHLPSGLHRYAQTPTHWTGCKHFCGGQGLSVDVVHRMRDCLSILHRCS